ncbi:MAG: flagellar basal body-associated FliL family protein [Bacillota bacterium]|nr:flagellar basal body-associated FliL family protein [Bacillota bacterium]
MANENRIQIDTGTAIFAIALLILAVVGASFTTYLFFRNATPPPPEMKEREELGPTAKIGDFTVNLADEGVVRHYVRTGVVLEVTNQQTLLELGQRDPQIKDAIISVLSSKTTADIRTPEGKAALRQEIADRINAFLNNGRVRRVYFTDFVFQ